MNIEKDIIKINSYEINKKKRKLWKINPSNRIKESKKNIKEYQ